MTKTRGVAILVLMVFGLWLVGRTDAPREAAARATPPPPVAETPWIPDGFQLSTESSVAYRWIDGQTCLLDSCWGIEAVARDGCPASLYIELSIMDKAGTAVGYTNDTVGALSAGQRAKLTFENSEDTGQKARITKVSCY